MTNERRRAPATPEEVRKELESAVVKTVAGFLNGHGGRLLIGVDDREADVGLVQDYGSSAKIGGPDGFARHLMQILLDRLVVAYVSVRVLSL